MRHLRWIVPLLAGIGVGVGGWIAQLRLAERPGDLADVEVLLPTLATLTALFGGPLAGLALAVHQGGRMLRRRRRERAAERRAVAPAFQATTEPSPAPAGATGPSAGPSTPSDPPQASPPRHPSIFDA